MVVPHDVDTQSVHAHGFNHQDTMLPILDRDSGKVYLTRIDFGVLLRIIATGIHIRLEWLVPATIMKVSCQTRNKYE